MAKRILSHFETSIGKIDKEIQIADPAINLSVLFRE